MLENYREFKMYLERQDKGMIQLEELLRGSEHRFMKELGRMLLKGWFKMGWWVGGSRAACINLFSRHLWSIFWVFCIILGATKVNRRCLPSSK